LFSVGVTTSNAHSLTDGRFSACHQSWGQGHKKHPGKFWPGFRRHARLNRTQNYFYFADRQPMTGLKLI
jgi:hypothetical protein